MNEPKYQLSRFLDANRNEQIVVRSDNLDEFIQMVGEMDELYPKGQANEGKQATPRNTQADEAIAEAEGELESKTVCDLHGKEMKFRSSRDGTFTWYDHRKKEGETWYECKGSGWKAR